MTEVANFVAEFDRIVKEAMPDPPREVKVQVSYRHGSTGWLSPHELRDAAADLASIEEIERLYAGSAFVDEDGPSEKADDSGFRASVYISGGQWVNSDLGVEGRKLTAVEGVFAAAKAAIDLYEERRKRAEEEAELVKVEQARQAEVTAAILKADADRAEERERPAADFDEKQDGNRDRKNKEGDQSRATASSRLRKFAYDPWTVTIGGGIIVALVVLLTQA